MIKFLVYDLIESLCVCRTIGQYLKRTEIRRNDHGQLLLGLIKPHKPVTSSAVSRWIVDLIGQAGIDTDILKLTQLNQVLHQKPPVQWFSWSSLTFKKSYHQEIRNKDIFQNIINSAKEIWREVVGDYERQGLRKGAKRQQCQPDFMNKIETSDLTLPAYPLHVYIMIRFYLR